MEIARARFQAAVSAAFVLDVGEGGDMVVDRAFVTLVKSGPTLQPATQNTPWTGTLGVVVDLGTDARLPGKSRRVLVGVEQVVALRVTD